MGLFDKLKSVAETVSKAAEPALKSSNEEPLSKDIQCGGIVSGADLPKQKDLSLRFGIDEDNQAIVVCEIKQGPFSSKHIPVKKYSLDDVVEFKHVKCETRDSDIYISTGHSNELVLSSGDTLSIYNSTSRIVKDTSSLIEQEMKEWLFLELLILTFADKMKDENTKQWLGEILAQEGAGVPFDENGEINLLVLFDTADKIEQCKYEDWAKRKQAYAKSLYN